MLICSKYVGSISDMINITLVNSKFKDNIDKLHFNPFKINQNSRKYFNNLQTQWLFDKDDELFTNCDISGYYVYYEISYQKYLEMKDKYQNIKFRRIMYTENDRDKYGYKIPSVVNLNDYLFQYAKILSTITIPTSITRIGDYCFSYCNPTSLTIPSNVIHCGNYIFSVNSGLKEVELPNNMIELSDGMFYKCLFLTKINIPSSLTKIGNKCFKECSSLKEIVMQMSVVEVGNDAFEDCSELHSITGNVDVCIKFKDSFTNTPFFEQLEWENERKGIGIIN